MGFLAYNFDSRHARRSRKGSIDEGDHLVSNKSLSQNFSYLIGVQGPSKLVKKNKTTPLCEPLPGEPLTQIKNFEQFSSYSGWRVTTKKSRANFLARAVVEGFCWHVLT